MIILMSQAASIAAWIFLYVFIIVYPALLIHATMGFKEFFKDTEAIFKRDPQEYLRKKYAKKQTEHP